MRLSCSDKHNNQEITLDVIATLDLEARILDWSEWKVLSGPPGHNGPSVYHWRERVVEVGTVIIATITEHARPSGVRQYVLTYRGAPSPLPKFDSWEQALDCLSEALGVRLEGLS